MFSGHPLWQGIIFSLVMWAAKVFVGIWLPAQHTTSLIWKRLRQREADAKSTSDVQLQEISPERPVDATSAIPAAQEDDAPSRASTPVSESEEEQEGSSRETAMSSETQQPTPSEKTSFLLPTLLLGSAMVARGEIGLLIINVARSASSKVMPEDLFIVSAWAILLCTVIGPVSVALLARKLKDGSSIPPEWR